MTTSSTFQQAPFLREQRQFPNTDLRELSNQTDHAYIDIAQKVNARTIGIFAPSYQIANGERWYLLGSSQRQAGLRQVYPFGAIAAGTTLTFAHGISNITQFTRIYGTCITSVPDYRPIPYASVTVNANIELKVTSTNIVISVGTASPNIVSGLIILEFLSQVTQSS